jgi:hypothetical protein
LLVQAAVFAEREKDELDAELAADLLRGLLEGQLAKEEFRLLVAELDDVGLAEAPEDAGASPRRASPRGACGGSGRR